MGELHAHAGDVVHREFVRRYALERGHVQVPFDRFDPRLHFARGVAQQVGAPGGERGRVEPDEVGFHAAGERRRGLVGAHEHFASADVEIVGEPDHDRIAGEGALARHAAQFDGGHAAAAPGGQHDDLLAHGDRAGRDLSRQAAVVVQQGVGGFARPADPLHGKAEGLVARAVLDGGALEHFQQRRAQVPGQMLAALDHHVAQKGRHGDVVAARAQAACLGEVLEGVDHRLEGGRVVVDQIHFVHRDRQRRDADEVGEQGVAPGLGREPLAHVDQQHGELGGGGGGDHVAGVLLVARRVGDDEGARAAAEVAVGDVDGDALFALGDQPVGDEREVGGGGSAAPAGAFDSLESVDQQRPAVVEQTPDERALAVIDAAAGEKAQYGIHQK